MINKNLFLILASGELNGVGYWLIDTTFNESPLIENKELFECHRKELIGEESAINILYAINLNLENLLHDIKEEGFAVEKPPKGISYTLPLDVMENIFDFWLETYQNNSLWETSLGLLKIKKRLSLLNIIESQGIKRHVQKLAIIIENLHKYRPNMPTAQNNIDPMWK